MDKPIILQFEADAKTVRMLRRCCEALGLTQEQVLRQGVQKVYETIEKRKGRPTENPKTIPVKFRLDYDTEQKLDACTESMQASKAEIIRKGIHKMYDVLHHDQHD